MPKAKIWTKSDPWLSKRIAHSKLIRRGDIAITNAVMTAMDQWLKAAVRAIYHEPQTQAGADLLGTDRADMLTADAGDNAASSSRLPDNMLPDLALWPKASAWQLLVETTVIPELTELFGEAFAKATREADITAQPYAEAYIALASDRLSTNLWPERVFEDVREVIGDGIAEGLSITHITEQLREVLEVDHHEWEARRIARTETMAAVNGGTWSGAMEYADITGERMFKQWYATMDSRTRDDHVRAHEQVVPIDVDFIVGGYSMPHPGDGPAEEVCNCRCTLLILDASEAAEFVDPSDWDTEGGDESAQDVADAIAEAEDNPAFAITIPPPDLEPSVTGSTLTMTKPGLRSAAGANAEAFARAAVIAPGSTPPVVQPPDQQTDGTADGGADIGCWYGVLAPLDTPSADGRMLAMPPTELDGTANTDEYGQPMPRTRPMPLPLMWQDALAVGHDGAVCVGLITDVWIEDGNLMGCGTFDLDDTRAAEIARKVAAGQLGWISVDLDDTSMEMRLPTDGGGNVDPLEILFGGDGIACAYDWRLMSATMVSQPAFPTAKIVTGRPDDMQPDEADSELTDEEIGAHSARPDIAFPFACGCCSGGGCECCTPGAFGCSNPECGLCASGTSGHLPAGLVAALDAYTVELGGEFEYRVCNCDRCEWTEFAQGADDEWSGCDCGECDEFGLIVFGRVGVPHPHRGHPGKRGPRGPRAGTVPKPHKGRRGLGGTRKARAGMPGTRKHSPHAGAKGPAKPRKAAHHSTSALPQRPMPAATVASAPISGGPLMDLPLSADGRWTLKVLHPDTGLPVADADQAWDGEAAAGRIADWASDADGDLDPGKYGRAFLFRDDDADATNKTAYKLGYADLIDGRLTIVPKAVYAVAGVLNGARGGADIPTNQQGEIKDAVSRLYGRLASALDDDSIVAPWDQEKETSKSSNSIRGRVAVSFRFGRQEYDTEEFAPPLAWFQNPSFPSYMNVTVCDDGRIFGHVAPFGLCHTGMSKCVTAPKSPSGYSYFHQGTVRTAEGHDVAVGTVFMGTDHAPTAGRVGISDAQRHYADTGMAAAVVRAGEDAHGIWIAGAVLPGADLVTLRRAPWSGDWRRIGPAMELCGVLCVNQPGFPVPRPAWSTDDRGVVCALTAAAGTAPARPEVASGLQVMDQFVTSLTSELVPELAGRLREEWAAERARDRRWTAALAKANQFAEIARRDRFARAMSQIKKGA